MGSVALNEPHTESSSVTQLPQSVSGFRFESVRNCQAGTEDGQMLLRSDAEEPIEMQIARIEEEWVGRLHIYGLLMSLPDESEHGRSDS